ncbi:hypothetical protein ACMC56_06030 [Campylobacterota bacterium DY0563]
MNLNFNKILKTLFPYIYIALAAYIISTIIFLFLPKSSVEFEDVSLNQIEYKNYSGFYSSTATVVNNRVDNRTNISLDSLSKYVLKAIYSTTTNSGWIIIESKSSKDTTILQQLDEFNGYTLTKLYKKYVIFEKNAKEYKLELPKEENLTYGIENNDSIKENIVVKDGSVAVQRDYLNTYVNDLGKVWKDIAIQEIRQNGKIDGFKINGVNKNSVFQKLGLKKNDIIKSVNGNVLKSYADAFKIYNGINKLNYLRLEVLRNNEVVELNYEIN